MVLTVGFEHFLAAISHSGAHKVLEQLIVDHVRAQRRLFKDTVFAALGGTAVTCLEICSPTKHFATVDAHIGAVVLFGGHNPHGVLHAHHRLS